LLKPDVLHWIDSVEIRSYPVSRSLDRDRIDIQMVVTDFRYRSPGEIYNDRSEDCSAAESGCGATAA